jgi:hypothetical protein
MKAQEYLDRCYPKDERKNIERLELSSRTIKESLEGHLDLSDFTNLVYLDIYHQSITSLNLERNNNLSAITMAGNLVRADLNIFSHLTNLQRLDLGWTKPVPFISNNQFSGSLKSLENCKNLEYLCIGSQDGIKQGLEYLPVDNLTYFGCHSTVFQNILRPYNYDVKAWKLVNHPYLISDKTEIVIEELGRKIREEQLEKDRMKSPGYSWSFLATDETKQKTTNRLENKIRLLETKRQEIIVSHQIEIKK